MTDQRTARLFGGHYDGTIATVTTRMLVTGLDLPIPPSDEDFAVAAPQLPEGERWLATPLVARVDRYEFDGTVNEAGEYRFRWHAS